MAKMKLTAGRVTSFTCPPDKQQAFLWDTEVPGLAVRALPAGKRHATGSRAFVFQGRIADKDFRVVLGDVRVLDIESGNPDRPGARELARHMQAKIDQGIDPRIEKRARIEELQAEQKKASETFGDLLKDYVSKKRRSKDNLPLKERTKADYLAMIAEPKEFANGETGAPGMLYTLTDKPATGIKAEDIREVHGAALKRGERQSAYAMQVLRAVLNWAGIKVPDNPLGKEVAGRDRIVIPQAKTARTSQSAGRPIPPERIGDWWRTLDRATSATTRDYLRFLVLTGCRPAEPKKILVKDCDMVAGRVVIRDTKNRADQEILLSRQAAEIVERNIAGKEPDDQLFTVVDGKKTISTVVERCGTAFRAKDLRPTFASIAEELVTAYTLKRMMNHANAGDVTGQHYVHKTDSALRAGWQAVADFIEREAAEVRAAAEVADIAKARNGKKTSKAAA